MASQCLPAVPESTISVTRPRGKQQLGAAVLSGRLGSTLDPIHLLRHRKAQKRHPRISAVDTAAAAYEQLRFSPQPRSQGAGVKGDPE
ncbi:hypothetical protein STEG23_014115 [Scotinomys teguina]